MTSRSLFVCRIGIANGSSLKPLMILPTMYAPLLRKKSEDSTWIWKLARSFTWFMRALMASTTSVASRSRSSKGFCRRKLSTMRTTSSCSVSREG